MGQTACKCPEPQLNPQFEEYEKAAATGKPEQISTFVSKGGDVNSCNNGGDTLLSIAASNGQLGVLKALAKSPYLHLNTYHPFQGAGAYTPLWLAAANGHLPCIKFLRSLNLSCRLDLVGCKQRKMSAVMIAAKNGHWNVAMEFLRDSKDLHSSEANYILPRAAKDLQWEPAQITLAKGNNFDLNVLKKLLHHAMENDRWKVIYSILQVDFRHKHQSINRVLAKAVKDRKWDAVEHLLGLMLPQEVSYDRALVEAAMSEKLMECTRLILEMNYTPAMWNGILMVIAAGGTTESIADRIYKVSVFSQSAVDNALYISALTGHLELLQQMFTGESPYKFSYSTLSHAHEAAKESGSYNAERLLSKILDKEAETFALNHRGK